VAPAAHGQVEAVVAGVADGGDDVGRGRGPHDDGRMAVVHEVVYAAVVLVALLARLDHRSLHALA
jgi:hypothetical protein